MNVPGKSAAPGRTGLPAGAAAADAGSTIDAPGLHTQAIHAAHAIDPVTGAIRPPVYASSGFSLGSAAKARRLFDGDEEGYVYSRIANPTVAAFEARMAALERGSEAVAAASGMAALHLALVALCSAGDHVVASSALYGGAYKLLAHSMREFGVETSFVDPRDPAAWEAALRPETCLMLGASLIYFDLPVLDVPRLADIAHAHGVPLLVDATYTTPALSLPLLQGADLVLHSASKFLCGNGSVLGGVLVEGGRFDWRAAHARHGRFRKLCEPAADIGGRRFVDLAPAAPVCARARRVGLARFGASLAAASAAAILDGVETLPLRMARHVANTREIVAFLHAHPDVAGVHYPELPGHPDRALASRLLPGGCGSIFTFELRGGRRTAQRFVDGLETFIQAGTVGDTRSLALAPAVSTHATASAAELAAAGLAEGSVRLSVGLEDARDLIADLGRGFAASRG